MKLGSWMVMLTVMMIFLTYIGITTGLNGTLEKLGLKVEEDDFNADVQGASWWNKLFNENTGILVLIGASAVAIGLFSRGYDPSLVIAPFVVAIAILFIGTFWSIIKYVNTPAVGGGFWMTALTTTIFGALSIGFAMSCVDYFAGR